MEPGLRDGDWLMVDPDCGLSARGLVVAVDPRAEGRLIVKRIVSVGGDGAIVVAGDHPAHGQESFRVPVAAVRGTPWFRYWPVRRIGRVS